MKFLVWFAITIIFGFLSVQLFHLYHGNTTMKAELAESMSEASALAGDNEQLEDDIDYYSEPENLAKELKSKFDYKKPGEKMIKIQ